MLCMTLVDVLDAKVVDYEDKCNWAPFVVP